MRSMLLLVMTILSLTVLTNCSKKECPKPQYPSLHAIGRVPDIYVTVNDGILDRNSTKKAFKTIKALRVSEHYYYSLISDYRKEFVK